MGPLGVGVITLYLNVVALSPCPEGAVDWVRQTIRARVLAPPDVQGVNLAQARLGAQKNLARSAVAALLECVKPLHVDSELSISEEISMAPTIRADLEKALGGYRTTARQWFSDGGLWADVEIPLATVAAVFAPLNEEPALPQRSTARKSHDTGLIVDARKLPVARALRGRLLDSSGGVLQGTQTLSTEARAARLPLIYVGSVAEARKLPQLGRRPRVMKAVRTQGVDVVVGDADAKRVRDAPYLREGNVAIAR